MDKKDLHLEDDSLDEIKVIETEEERLPQVKESESIKVNKPEKRERLSATEYFVERILNKMTEGDLDVQENEFEVTYSRIMSATNKKRVIAIREFPEMVFPGHLEAIRDRIMKRLPMEDRPKARVNIISHNMPYRIYINGNKKIDRSRKNFESQYRELKSDLVRSTAAELTNRFLFNAYKESNDSKIIRMKRLFRKIGSFYKLKDYQTGGGALVRSYIFLECCGDTIEICDTVARIATEILITDKYKYKEVTELQDYIKHFGAASLDYQNKMKINAIPMTLTAETSASDITYQEGIIRSDQGDVYVMTSIQTGYPVHISFSESASNNNMLIVADSGSGKTVLVKSMMLNALNHKGNTYNFVVDDIKGNEYNFDKYIKGAEVISMGIANPKFINTLAIPDYKKFGFNTPQAAFDLCFSSTVKLLSTLVGSENRENSPVFNICYDIVDQAYTMMKVDRAMEISYINSHKYIYREVLWDAIESITKESKTMTSRHGSEGELGLVRTCLEPYFMDRGAKSYMFENALDINAAMDLKVLIFDYGAQTAGGQASMLDNELEARLLMRNFFSNLYAASNKLKNEFTIIIEEEIQRQINNPHLAKTLNDAVTGGRSSNMSVIMITNTISSLLHSKDANIAALRENVKTLMLGKVKEEVARETIQFFGFNRAMGRVLNMLAEPGKYQNAFFLAFDTGKVFDMTIGRVSLPPNIINHDIFKSRDVEQIRKSSAL